MSLKFVDEWNKKWFMAVKGPRGALLIWVQEMGHFVCYYWKYKKHAVVCKNHIYI